MTARATPDCDEIVRVVQLYVDGFNDGDINKFKQAFHDDAWIFFTDRLGGLHKGLLDDSMFAPWASEGRKGIDARIIAVTQAGDIANVLLGWDDPNPSLVGGFPHAASNQRRLEDHE
jgi:hypothetical protein